LIEYARNIYLTTMENVIQSKLATEVLKNSEHKLKSAEKPLKSMSIPKQDLIQKGNK